MKRLVAGIVQQRCTADREANLQKSVEGIRRAAGSGARLVVLQELHLGLYFCQSEDVACFDLAETVPGPATETLGIVARELGVVLVASVFERRAAGLYHNTAVVIERDGSIAGIYRKMHIPDDPGYFEKYYFTPGDLGFSPVRTSVGKLGVLVCWDQWYPEAARLMALAGAELLIYPTAIGWETSESEEDRRLMLDAWITIQRSHAVANGVPVITANRVGFEPAPGGMGCAGEATNSDSSTASPGESPDAPTPPRGQLFWGHSFITGPQGELLGCAVADEETILTAEIDLERIETVRRNWPFLRDRRIDAYQDLLRRYRD